MPDVIFDLVKVVVPVVATALSGLAVWAIKDARRVKIESASEAKDAMELMTGAILVLIRHQLVRAHYSAVSREVITISERQSFLEMSQLYRNLGGNGPATHLVEDIKRLPIVPD